MWCHDVYCTSAVAQAAVAAVGLVAAAVWVVAAAAGTAVVQAAEAAVEQAATVALAAQAATQRKERRLSNSHRQWQMKTRRTRAGMQSAGVT